MQTQNFSRFQIQQSSLHPPVLPALASATMAAAQFTVAVNNNAITITRSASPGGGGVIQHHSNCV